MLVTVIATQILLIFAFQIIILHSYFDNTIFLKNLKFRDLRQIILSESARSNFRTNDNSDGMKFDSYLLPKLKVVKSENEFINLLRKSAQRKLTLSSADKQMLAFLLLDRCKNMSVKNVAITLWCLGTLKLPTRNKVFKSFNLHSNIIFVIFFQIGNGHCM